VGVTVGVSVLVAVGVSVPGTVGVLVLVAVGVLVLVAVGVLVLVAVGVLVLVAVGVLVLVVVGVLVLVVVGVLVLVAVGVGCATAQPAGIVLESIVTAPFRAKARPDKLALVFMVMLVSARILPRNVVVVSSVAELPTCQNTLQAFAPLIMTTDELGAVMSVLPIWKTKTALGSPCASSVRIPVKNADDVKQ
jgi:hypothetical protein